MVYWWWIDGGLVDLWWIDDGIGGFMVDWWIDGGFMVN